MQVVTLSKMFVTSRCSSHTEATVVCDKFIKISTGAGILMISDVMMTCTNDKANNKNIKNNKKKNNENNIVILL